MCNPSHQDFLLLLLLGEHNLGNLRSKKMILWNNVENSVKFCYI